MSLGKDRYYQAEGDYEQEYEGGQRGQAGTFIYSKSQLAEVCNLDNHSFAGSKEYPQMRISSQMIVDNLEGQDAIVAALHSNIKTGISGTPQDIQDRQRIYGENRFPPPVIKTIMELILENFEDPINKVLLIAAMVSLVIGLYKEGFPAGLIEGTSIAIALVIICTVTSLNNWFSEKRLAELVALSDKQEVAVFRGSDKAVTIDAEDLVVGDVMKFSMGEKIPADMMMVEGQDVTCNESELTGEPDSLEKVPVTRDNYQDGAMSTMLAKSLCDAGVGRAIVMAVGTETVAGVITLKTQAAPEQTLLQKKLDNMAGKIGNIGLMVAIGTFLACVVRIIIEALGGLPCGCMNIFVCREPIPDTCVGYDFSDIGNQVYPELLEAIIIGITVVVVAIPEGLPLAVTISLSFSSAKMQKLNNLVRKIASSETMGGATHICSDKTGTLTENSMTVMSVMAVERVTEAGKTQTDEFVQETQSTFKQVSFSGMNIWDILVEGVIWNSSAWIEKNDNKQNANEPDYITKGNVTEQGIMKLFMKAMSPTWCLNKMSDKKDDMILCNIPFTSKRKMGSIVVRRAGADRDHEVRVYTKGAPDMLLPKCSFAINGQGKLSQIDQRTPVPNTLLKEGESGVEDTYRGLFDRTIKKFADQAYRTILITYKDMSMEEFESIKAANNNFAKEGDRVVLEENLITVGIFGLQDPLRGTIVDSINKCRTAGIQVIMCTGDNIDTAIAISKNAGIVTQEEIARNSNAAMTGKHFREAVGGLVKRTDENGKEIDQVADMSAFREIKKELRVLARSSPEDKYLLVTGIQDSEGVVAVTGDGTNDAPALTKADVGFAMGITGTDVAKGACDIILLDDNFSSIIVALKYGRNVYDNVRKFLQFQLTVNFVAMFIVFLGAVVTKKSPLNAVQMLWVNLIMDTFAALALATEPPPADILTRMPYKKDNPIITPVMSRNVQGHAIYQMIGLLVILFAGPATLIDNDYELQCNKYHENGTCVETDLNPFYTKTEYYEFELWKQFTEAKDEVPGSIKMKRKLLPKYAFNDQLLYKWRCNLFLQDNYHYSGYAESMKLCTLPDPYATFTDPMLFSQYLQGKSEAERDIVKEFAKSGWHSLSPEMEFYMGADEVKYSSKGFSTEETKLFSFVFNAFVFMQVFNQINARMLEHGEFNVFKGMMQNKPFLAIMLVTILVQILMVEVGGRFVKCWPLNTMQNIFCILIGAGELIWGILVKFVPTGVFINLSLEDRNNTEGDKKKYISTAMKGKGPKN